MWNPPSLLSVDGLCLGRPDRTLIRDASFRVPYGVVGAVVGPTAARRVLFEWMAGSRQASAGQWSVEGKAADASRRPRGMAALVEDPRELVTSTALDPTEYAMIGVLGRVHARVRGVGDSVKRVVRRLHDGTDEPRTVADTSDRVSSRLAAALLDNRLVILDSRSVLLSEHGRFVLLPRLRQYCIERASTILLSADHVEQLPQVVTWCLQITSAGAAIENPTVSVIVPEAAARPA